MEERWPDTPRMTHQGISPSLPTSTPPKNTITTTTMTQLGPYQGGSCLPWKGVAPPSPPFGELSTSSLSTTGASWPRSTATAAWTSSAKLCAARSISLNKRSRWLKWSAASARGGLKLPGPTAKSNTYGWAKPDHAKSKTELGWTWYTKIGRLGMDMGVHSDEEHGVTGLGRVQPL